jgi:hypothetical protein
MYARRAQRQQSPAHSGFVQAHRALGNGENIPALPGLADQLAACRTEMSRVRRQPVDAEALAGEAEDLDMDLE